MNRATKQHILININFIFLFSFDEIKTDDKIENNNIIKDNKNNIEGNNLIIKIFVFVSVIAIEEDIKNVKNSKNYESIMKEECTTEIFSKFVIVIAMN